MLRLPTNGRLLLRGRIWWCRFKFRRQAYERSLDTPNKLKAMAERDALIEKVRVSIRDGTFAKEFGRGDENTTQSSRDGNVPLAAMWTAYAASKNRPAQALRSTLEQYALQVDVLLSYIRENHPGVNTMGEVTASMVEAFFNYLEKGRHVRPRTERKYLRLMKSIWSVLAPESPCPWSKIRLATGAVNKREMFTEEEVTRIIETATGWIRHVFMLAFYTGQRTVDICLLRWEKVNFSARKIHVRPCKTRNNSKPLDVELEMHPRILQYLSELHVGQGRPKAGYVMPELASLYRRNRSEIATKIREFLVAMGFEVHQPKEDKGKAIVKYSLHSVRHTFISLLENFGVARSVLREIVGGSVDYYSHGDVEGKRKAIASLPDVAGKTGSGISFPDHAPDAPANMSDEDLRLKMVEITAEWSRRNGDKRKAG